VLSLPGGGGMGNPAERDPALVARDVRDGLVSAGSAERDYRVALTPDGAVDEAATARLRR
jgi:N-methylhydantoinase B